MASKRQQKCAVDLLETSVLQPQKLVSAQTQMQQTFIISRQYGTCQK